jgi:hypothetical protein
VNETPTRTERATASLEATSDNTVSLSTLEAALAFLIIAAATVGAMASPNPIGGDALIGLYASILGYVFGRKATSNGG